MHKLIVGKYEIKDIDKFCALLFPLKETLGMDTVATFNFIFDNEAIMSELLRLSVLVIL